MKNKDLRDFLSRFPDHYDVKIQTMPELDYSPYLIVVDNPAHAEIYIHAMHDPLARTSSYADIELDSRGEFITKKGEK